MMTHKPTAGDLVAAMINLLAIGGPYDTCGDRTSQPTGRVREINKCALSDLASRLRATTSPEHAHDLLRVAQHALTMMGQFRFLKDMLDPWDHSLPLDAEILDASACHLPNDRS